MEERKEIAEKMAVKIGAMEGKRIVSDIKAMRIKCDIIIKAYLNKRREEDEKRKNKINDKEEELSNMLEEEVIQYAPKYIENYFDKESIKTVDNAIDIFSSHLKELTLKIGTKSIVSCEFEGLLVMYKKLVVNDFKKIATNSPKDIKLYFESLFSQHESILEDWYDEELKKSKIVSTKKHRKELHPIMSELIHKLCTTVDSRATKRFDKVKTEMEKGRYNLKRAMSKEEFARFLLRCLSTFYFEGVFSEYNKDSIKDIYPFHVSSAPYFNEEGQLDKEGIFGVDVEASKKLITSHFSEPDLGDLFDKD